MHSANMTISLFVFLSFHIAFIRDLFKTVHFSEKGTDARIREESTIMLFVDLLNSCEGTCMLVLNYACHVVYVKSVSILLQMTMLRSASTVLSFFTGAEVPPPIGFHPATLRFSERDTEYPHSIYLCSGTHSSDQMP